MLKFCYVGWVEELGLCMCSIYSSVYLHLLFIQREPMPTGAASDQWEN